MKKRAEIVGDVQTGKEKASERPFSTCSLSVLKGDIIKEMEGDLHGQILLGQGEMISN